MSVCRYALYIYTYTYPPFAAWSQTAAAIKVI